MIHERINIEIQEIWKRQNHSKLVPQFYGAFTHKSCLTIGLNPSFSVKGYNSFLRNSLYQSYLLNLPEKFSIVNFNRIKSKENQKAKIVDFIAIEKISKENYYFYLKLKSIADENKLEWEHVDLFFYRDTKSEIIEKLFCQKEDTVKDQLALSSEIIRSLEPKVIIVANALASKIFHEQFNPKWIEKKGTYFLDSVPVFYSGMLSGHLDNGSLKRLNWHIRHVLK